MVLQKDILPDLSSTKYQINFAKTDREIENALQLRYDIFNVELKRGFNFKSGRDYDEYDKQFHHLLVKGQNDEIIGTYRLQTWEQAQQGLGFYSEKRFDLSGIPISNLQESVEVGRACIRSDHRSGRVLFMLWKGLAAYMQHFNKRYLFGSSAITGSDLHKGWKAYRKLEEKDYLHANFTAPVLDHYRFAEPENLRHDEKENLPGLFKNYLDIGCKVCGGPAFDKKADSIYFITLLDINDLTDRTRKLFFS